MVAARKHPCRSLTLGSLDELEAELDRIERAHHAGTLTTCGNWSAGKILGHLAAWIDYAFDGFPMRPPTLMKVFCRVFKGMLLRPRAMKPGMRIPGAAEGTYGVEEMDVPTGLARLRAALRRLREQQPREHPLFGALTKEEWVRMHLAHASLHLGFLRIA